MADDPPPLKTRSSLCARVQSIDGVEVNEPNPSYFLLRWYFGKDESYWYRLTGNDTKGKRFKDVSLELDMIVHEAEAGTRARQPAREERVPIPTELHNWLPASRAPIV